MKKQIKKVLLAILVLTILVVPTGMLKADAGTILVWPVPGHTNLTGTFSTSHQAIDISDGSIAGATVVCAMGGTVERIYLCTEHHDSVTDCCSGFGTGIVIKGDDGRHYQYAHMQEGSIPSNVYYGAYVSAGAQVGRVGNTGFSYGEHLHFQIGTTGIFEGCVDPMLETYSNQVPASAPTSAYLTMNKKYYALNETINFSVSSEYATGYTIGINKYYPEDGSYERIYTGNTDKNYSWSTNEAGYYEAYYTVGNSLGYIDSNHIIFSVGVLPQNVKLTSDKNKYNVNETVCFSASCDWGAVTFHIGIDKYNFDTGSYERVLTQSIDQNFEYKFADEGMYSAYVTAWNDVGITDSDRITFTVGEIEKVSGYYTYIIDENGNATITDCDPSISGEVTVPQTLDGYPVTKIRSNAFSGCESITGITVLENVEYIDVNAFSNCTSLKYANIMAQEDTLTSILTFENCSNLETVYLHNLNSVGSGKFYENFMGCDKLKSIEFSENNPYLKSVDGVVYSKDGATLWYVPNGISDETYYVPETVTEIAGAAFCDCVNIKNIYIYGNETEINEKFYTVNMGFETVSFSTKHGGEYEKLDDVTIHAATDSYAKAYADKNGINFVELTETTTPPTTAPDDEPTTNPDSGSGTYGLFTYEIVNGEVTIISCAPVEDGDGYVEIPSEIEGYPVTALAEYSFFNSLGVRKLTIPNTVKTIGDGAFACDFESIVIPESVTNIGNHVFINCNYLKTITVDENNPCYSSDEYGTLFNKDMTELICHPSKNSRTDYDVADSVVKIAEYAFWNSNIEYLSINKNVTDIGDYAFGLCTNLKNIIVDEENPNYSSDDCGVLFNKDKTVLINYPAANERKSYTMPETVTEIEMCAFEWAVNLENIGLSDKLETIGYSAFYGCTSLESINIPDGVTMLDDFTFRMCSSLEEVILPQSLKIIDVDVFMECISLKEIDLPDGLIELGPGAFSDCTALEKVYIPCSVNEIGYNAFMGCVNLEYVHIPDTVKEIGENILDGTEDAYICSYTEDCCAKEYAEEYGYEFRLCDNHGMPIPEESTNPSEPSTNPSEPSTNPSEPTTNPSEPSTKPNDPENDSELYNKNLIKTPSTTVIKYADSIVLHADLSGYPEGAVVKWSMNNGNFEIASVSEDGSECIITPSSSGDTTFTAIVYDENGKVLGTDTQKMTSKAGILEIIIGFFKKIFGLTKTIPQLYRGVFK